MHHVLYGDAHDTTRVGKWVGLIHQLVVSLMDVYQANSFDSVFLWEV